MDNDDDIIIEVEDHTDAEDRDDGEDYSDAMDYLDGDEASALAAIGWGTDEDYGHYGSDE